MELVLENYKLAYQGDQWVLFKKGDENHHRRKAGSEPGWRPLKYYLHLHHATHAMLNISLEKEGNLTVQALQDAYNNVSQAVEAYLELHANKAHID